MNKIFRSMAVLVLALVGLVGCDYRIASRRGCESSPCGGDEADLSRSLARAHLLGSARRVEHRDDTIRRSGMPPRRRSRPIRNRSRIRLRRSTVKPASEKLYSLLDVNIDAVREYSEATVAGNKQQQDAALARLASNADDIADFLSHVNPYLQKDNVRGLIAAHGAHHVLQINQYKKKDYAPPRGNLADDATTRLCHCGYADHGIGEAVSQQVLMTGERHRRIRGFRGKNTERHAAWLKPLTRTIGPAVPDEPRVFLS